MGVRRPTQNEVAKLAGVSRSTVSLVLNGRTDTGVQISHETVQRVTEAARTLGYSPNPTAQMLARGRNNLIGVFSYESIFPQDQQDFYFPFLLGIERAAGRLGYDLLLFTGDQTGSERKVYHNSMNSLRLADGSIVMGASTDRQELARLTEESYPFVCIGERDVPGAEINWVAGDYRSGSLQAARHLLDLGHRCLGIVQSLMPIEAGHAKLAGCRQAVAEVPGASLTELSTDAVDSVKSLTATITSYALTALLFDYDIWFTRALGYLQAAGMCVPHDLSVLCLVSVGNRHACPQPPTYVDSNQVAVGETAAEVLAACIQGVYVTGKHVLIRNSLVIGETTAPPPLRS